MFHIVFYQPCIPQNTGNAIRLAANTGSHLHLIEPLGFDMDATKLKRAGLDYHDLASVSIHPDFDAFIREVNPPHIYAFSSHASCWFNTVAYAPNDALLFGAEPHGLPPEMHTDPRITQCLRIPMLAPSRSLNLANSASIVAYEAWRQHAFLGAQ